MDFERGHIFRVNLEPTQGSEQQGTARPCVILSITPLNAKLRQVGVVPLSTSARALPPVVVAVPSAGVSSVALCHQLRTIDKARKHLGEVSAADLTAIENAVRQVYAL
jgi:mRNA interferase MazF